MTRVRYQPTAAAGRALHATTREERRYWRGKGAWSARFERRSMRLYRRHQKERG